jgi:hypothetical protein
MTAKNHKYDSCVVLHDVYTSSTYHTFVDVIMLHSAGKPREKWHIELSGCTIDAHNSNRNLTIARYQYGLIANALRAFLETEHFTRHEYDRDGNQRYEGLRYSPEPNELIELVQRAIAFFDKQAQKGIA